MKSKLLVIAIACIAVVSCTSKTDIKPEISSKTHDSVAMTPPMGWNSYDCYGATVTEQEVKDNAKMMAVHLKQFGWEYIIVDYCWFYPYPGALNNPPQLKDFSPNFRFDDKARLLPAIDRFPGSANEAGFKPLADHIHGLGLKFGIHVMRGISREAVAKKLPIGYKGITADQIADTKDTCKWLNSMYGVDMSKPGAQEYYNSLFELYASWGVDFVKVDDIVTPYYADEIDAIRTAIDNCGRSMVLSLSPGDETNTDKIEHLKSKANMWRISSDFWDNWESLKHQFTLCHQWESFVGPGHWPDADMIPIGLLSRRGPEGEERRSNFTQEEQKTLMTLWAIFRSPLMLGGDLTMIRPTELALITNSEVLEINQKSNDNHELRNNKGIIVWTAGKPGTTDKYVAMFNTNDGNPENVTLSWEEIGLDGELIVYDLWAKKELGAFKGEFSAPINAHGAGLYRISKN